MIYHEIEVIKMDTKKEYDTTTKSIRFESEMLEQIQKMADEAERDFSGQVRFMLKEYIKIREKK